MVQNRVTDAANSGLVRVQYGPTRTDPFSSLSLSLSPFPNVGSFSSQPACHASPVDWKVLVIEPETTISPPPRYILERETGRGDLVIIGGEDTTVRNGGSVRLGLRWSTLRQLRREFHLCPQGTVPNPRPPKF